MKRVLMTGAGGFVGANLTRRLVRDGVDVHAVVSPWCDTWRIDDVRPRIHLHRADLRVAEMRDLVGSVAPDVVFHLAAYGSSSDQRDVARMIDTNIRAAAELVDACVDGGVTRFVQAGSSSEYGWKDHAPLEDEAVEPNSAYAVTKVAATNYAELAGRRSALQTVTLRLYSVYGPFEGVGRLMPVLALHAARGGWPPLVSPEVAHDFVFIDDVVEAFMLAATAPLPRGAVIYNVASGSQSTLADVVRVAGEICGVTTAPAWNTLPRRAWDTDHWVGCADLIARDLGWRAATDLETGFRRLVDWLAGHQGLRRRYVS